MIPLIPAHVAKLGEITGKTRVLFSELGEITGKTRVLPCGRWDMVKNNQLQLYLTNKEHALNFDRFSKWIFISLMNYNFLIS